MVGELVQHASHVVEALGASISVRYALSINWMSRRNLSTDSAREKASYCGCHAGSSVLTLGKDKGFLGAAIEIPVSGRVGQAVEPWSRSIPSQMLREEILPVEIVFPCKCACVGL